MAKAKTIKDLKQLALRAFLMKDPTQIPSDDPLWQVVLKVIAGNATLNHAYLSCVLAGIIRPGQSFTIGKGWGGEKHGGAYAQPGWELTGGELLQQAMIGERWVGMHGGGREAFGYFDAYGAGYLLALRHALPVCAEVAADLLRIALHLQYLLTVPGSGGDVVELGGRATGKVADDLSILQRLWRGQDPHVGEGDWLTAAKMWQKLRPEERDAIGPPPAGIPEAIEELKRLDPVLPCGFSWWGWADGAWTAQVERGRSWFVHKRTGERSLVVATTRSGAVGLDDAARDVPVVPSYAHHYHVPMESKGSKPTPGEKPPPEEPVPEKPSPRPHPIRRWQVGRWLKDGGAPEWAFDLEAGIPEIIWQAQQMERGVVEAEGRLVVLVKEMNERRKG